MHRPQPFAGPFLTDGSQSIAWALVAAGVLRQRRQNTTFASANPEFVFSFHDAPVSRDWEGHQQAKKPLPGLKNAVARQERDQECDNRNDNQQVDQTQALWRLYKSSPC